MITYDMISGNKNYVTNSDKLHNRAMRFICMTKAPKNGNANSMEKENRKWVIK